MMKMVAVNTGAVSMFSKDEFTAFDRIKKAGFNAVDYSFYFLPDDGSGILAASDTEFDDYFMRLSAHAREIGLSLIQSHAHLYGFAENNADEERIRAVYLREIRAAGIMKCPYIVIHPAIPPRYKYFEYRAQTRKYNLKWLGSLIPALESADVRLGVENMFNYDYEKSCICPTVCTTAAEMLDYCDMLGERFVACLDIGHANLIHCKDFDDVTPEKMINTLGGRLNLLHVHDNDGISDLHMTPFTCSLDFKLVANALKNINYSGAITLETDAHINKAAESGDDIDALLLQMHEAALAIAKASE
ncbi:MAG: sugar phosphate isomerase/epimerase family protein [Oscillospiraceae bacterium]|nr:sugar phosphate isomerase/epimerase family protein [Oscillospiraceae bacterium]